MADYVFRTFYAVWVVFWLGWFVHAVIYWEWWAIAVIGGVATKALVFFSYATFPSDPLKRLQRPTPTKAGENEPE